jgi:HAE1 family hydrophobic/amphiphilic exporter-1
VKIIAKTTTRIAGLFIIMFIFSHCSFVDTDTGQALRHPETQVSIDREKASDLGVKMGTIASGLRTMVGGEKVSLFREGDEQYNVRLRLIADYRKDAGQIENLTVPGADGNLVKLSNATRFISGTSPAQVDRYAQERQITVISNLYKKLLGEAITEFNIILKEMNMPSAYSASFLGRGKLIQEAFYNFMIAFVLSLIFIYMVFAAQFESFIHPVTIMLALRFAMANQRIERTTATASLLAFASAAHPCGDIYFLKHPVRPVKPAHFWQHP